MADIPTQEEIAKLPRLAIVAFAARCARRVQPLFGGGEKHTTAVRIAIEVSEQCAAGNEATDPHTAAHGARVGTGSAVAATAGSAAAASYAATSAGNATAMSAAKPAAAAASCAASSVDYAKEAATTAAIRRDFDLLLEASERENWDDDTPVPPEFFGPMWPDGEPEGWPKGEGRSHPPAKTVFVSYSYRDAEALHELQAHLKPLEEQFDLQLWSDERFAAGDDFGSSIQTAIEGSDAAILLISANFLASDFIASKELPAILARAQANTLKVFPVYVGHVPPLFYERVPPTPTPLSQLAQIQGINSPETPTSTLSPQARARVFARCAETLGELLATSSITSPSLPPNDASGDVLSDEQIVADLLAGRERGRDELLAAHGQRVREALKRKYGERSGLTAALESAADQISEQAHKFDPKKGTLGAYLYAAASGNVLEHLQAARHDTSPKDDSTVREASPERTPAEAPALARTGGMRLLVDPGNASKERMRAVFRALSNLHVARGGMGLEFVTDEDKVYVLKTERQR